jgi:CheY-like chemotaxis protein
MRKAYLESQGYTVITATSGEEGLELLKSKSVDGVVLDYRMPGMDGGQVAQQIRRTHHDLAIVMLSGFPHDIPDDVFQMVNAVVVKGEAPHALRDALNSVLPEAVKNRRAPKALAHSTNDVRKHVQRVREVASERRRSLESFRDRHPRSGR